MLIIKHIIEKCTKYSTLRMNKNMPYKISVSLREDQIITIAKFSTQTKIINTF